MRRAATCAPRGSPKKAIRAADDIGWTILRPSLIFGADDAFLNRFARLMQRLPLFPLARPNARFGPVFVGDVCAAIERCIEDDDTRRQTLQLCGPRVYSLREIVALIRNASGQRGITVGLPDAVARIQARIMEWLPGKPFTMDNYRSLTVNSICEQNGFESLGIVPRSLAELAPALLRHSDRNSRFSRFRRTAGRRA